MFAPGILSVIATNALRSRHRLTSAVQVPLGEMQLNLERSGLPIRGLPDISNLPEWPFEFDKWATRITSLCAIADERNHIRFDRWIG